MVVVVGDFKQRQEPWLCCSKQRKPFLKRFKEPGFLDSLKALVFSFRLGKHVLFSQKGFATAIRWREKLDGREHSHIYRPTAITYNYRAWSQKGRGYLIMPLDDSAPCYRRIYLANF